MGKFQDLLKSRRFWVAMGGVAAIVLRDQLHLPLTDEQIQAAAVLIGAWIVGETLRSSEAPKLP